MQDHCGGIHIANKLLGSLWSLGWDCHLSRVPLDKGRGWQVIGEKTWLVSIEIFGYVEMLLAIWPKWNCQDHSCLESRKKGTGSCSVLLLGQVWALEAELIKKRENNQDRWWADWLPIREQFSRSHTADWAVRQFTARKLNFSEQERQMDLSSNCAFRHQET